MRKSFSVHTTCIRMSIRILILASPALTGCPETTVHGTREDGGATDDGSAVGTETGTGGAGRDAAGTGATGATGGAGGTGGGSETGGGGASGGRDGGEAGTGEPNDEDAGTEDGGPDSAERCSCSSEGPCCDGCFPIGEGQSCQGQELDCADDVCRAGACVQEVKAGFCLIDGACHSDADTNPEEPCQFCDTVFNKAGWRDKPQGVECDDGLFCNGADTCGNSGACSVHEGDPCASGDECRDQCDEETQSCLSPEATPCGNRDDDICSAPDSCDGQGVCQPNHAEEGTFCSDDDESDNACSERDTCDGEGVCVPNHVEAGEPCGDDKSDECTAPDTCDGAGGCLPNHQPEGTQCFGQDWMIYNGQCNTDGVCDGSDYCDAHPCWTILPTDQNTCYDDAGAELEKCAGCADDGTPPHCGQDGHYRGPSRYFNVISGVGYRDTVTNLVWALSSEEGTMSWLACDLACSDKGTGGYEDWRMPDYYEMAGAMSFGACSYDVGLPGTASGDMGYWTSTEVVQSIDDVWTVVRAFACGALAEIVPQSQDSYYCRCVRGERLSRNDIDGLRFVSSGESSQRVVMDRATGLLWQKTFLDTSSGSGWKEALAYCESLDYGGYDDWRLPDINELFSLVNAATADVASEFPDMLSLLFASSTTSLGFRNGAWTVDFGTGAIAVRDKTDTDFAVRCVRCGLGLPCEL